jgi:hypothetical protein
VSLSKTLSGWRAKANRVMLIPMVDVLMLLGSALTSLFRSRVRLEAEILALRQQINVLRRNSPKRFVFRTFDRLVLVASLPAFWMRWLSSGLRPWFVGTVPDFDRSGVGNPGGAGRD